MLMTILASTSKALTAIPSFGHFQKIMAIHGTKEMLNYARDNSVADGLRYAATWQSGMFHAHEVLEAMTAGFEKRAPTFENLQPNIPKITR